MIIKEVSAREVLDSRGMPTVCARVVGEEGSIGRASVPSGASVGRFEALELRDGDMGRFGGKGVLGAVANVNGLIGPRLRGLEFATQSQLDAFLRRLDGTENKSCLGANALLAVSMAGARALAKAARMPLYEFLWEDKGKFILPTPLMNILNGGAHADNNMDIQEFMVVPLGAGSFREAVRMGAETYMALKARLKKKGLSTAVGDEGGFAPDLPSDEAAIELLLCAVADAGLQDDVALALDVAAGEWAEGQGRYRRPKSGEVLSREELCSYFLGLLADYPIVSLEDPLADDDEEGFALLRRQAEVQLVGDDLYVTSTRRIEWGAQKKLANAILIKPNQIGTVSEAREAVLLGRKHGMASIVSHRSGETEDALVADLAVALS
ncbi:MAG: phosphopyruvate hydratase, partial [Christensenellaceae bacterium]|nr:phosphopyruvate hydratase [Christensenellaceae bacterium]